MDNEIFCTELQLHQLQENQIASGAEKAQEAAKQQLAIDEMRDMIFECSVF